MSYKHTPGPWKFDHDMDGDFLIWADSKPCIAITDHDHEDDKANGQLMAAAPELLAVLETALVWEMDYRILNNLGKRGPDWVVRGLAAVAKAKGESL